MAYTRTNWVEEETPLSAQNLNNIEDGIEELQSQKVDKVSGKALSDQNYTATEKTKLAGIETGAQVNRTYNAVTGKPATSLAPRFGSGFTISQVSQDANGQVSVTDRNIILPGDEATTTSKGLMSAADKTKLNNLPTAMVRVNAKLNTAVNVGARKTAKLSLPFTASGIGYYNSALLMDIDDMPSGIAINSISFSSFTLVLYVVNATSESVRIPAGTNAHVLLLQGV